MAVELRDIRKAATLIDERATATTRARYDRIARLYDLLQTGAERRFAPWRAELWRRAGGPRVLEVGVGTGQNVPHYPPGAAITAVDLSPRMLDRARARARREGVTITLQEADVQALPFPDASFDAAVATFVFCSVPDPVLGLTEVRRVLVPGGQLLLLEHVLSCRPLLRRAMHLANGLVVRLWGANVDRETVENVYRAGFVDLRVANLWLDVVKLIEARAPDGGPRRRH
ncbi:MAG: methyltransferase domain-containing protein [Chloroflexi bacterium]|nr:methyltransferase domain-containing protein [Chloroflexota bacterium]